MSDLQHIAQELAAMRREQSEMRALLIPVPRTTAKGHTVEEYRAARRIKAIKKSK